MQKGEFVPTAANKEAGRALRRIRLALSDVEGRIVTQKEFGERLGQAMDGEPIGQSTISDYEGGRAGVTAGILLHATRLLGARLRRAVTLDEAFSGIKVSSFPVAA